MTDLDKYFQYSPFFVDSTSMSDLDWDNLQNKIDLLPQNISDVLVDAKTADFIGQIVTQNGLGDVQGVELARIIRSVSIGELYLGDFISMIATKLQIDQTKAKEIANMIISQLFGPAIEDIKKVQIQKFGSSAQSTAPTTNHYPGEDLPETGGNIIDLRQK